jgi:hypothetical protein
LKKNNLAVSAAGLKISATGKACRPIIISASRKRESVDNGEFWNVLAA